MRSTATLFAILVVTMAGCSTRQARSRPTEPATYLEVDNQHRLDMTIYVVRSAGNRERLGTSIAHTVQRFRIPDRLMFGLTPLRFQADPIGGNASPVTQEITVEPGDTVVLRIPPG